MVNECNMEKDSTFTFIIDHIDPLGQGVFKQDNHVFFIPKTLPGESGTAIVRKTLKSKLHFCELVSISKKSDQRVTPECEHFDKCNGCHLLHTTRENELDYKIKSFERMLKSLNNSKVEVIQGEQRLNYRNRVQLHYNKKFNSLGYKKSKSRSILDVPRCKVIRPEIQSEFTSLYDDWKRLTKKPFGHIELYLKGKSVLKSVDKSYAQGGFSQVNEAVNLLMLDKISEITKDIDTTNVIDLFAGGGNISNAVDFEKRFCVDIYENGTSSEEFSSINLFEEDALEIFKSIDTPPIDLLILDPPRSGFKNLNKWIKHFRPKNLLYISCHPMTMVRDLTQIDNIDIKETYMIDLFPSTYHFEGMCLIDLSKAY